MKATVNKPAAIIISIACFVLVLPSYPAQAEEYDTPSEETCLAEDFAAPTEYSEQTRCDAVYRQTPSHVPAVRGDINGDGFTSVSDVVMLQKQLLDLDDTGLIYSRASDLNGDSTLDITDLYILTRLVLYPAVTACP